MKSISKRKSGSAKSALVLSIFCAMAGFTALASEKNGEHGNPPPSSQEQWDALASLQEGNKRFSEGRARHPLQSEEDRLKLADGQHPPVIVLSCSDSRVPPEMVFDQGLGQVFTVRVAGNVPNSDAIASIEYALEHLGSKVLVVMGHDSCGAVKAALTTPDGKSAGSPHLDGLLAKIRPSVSKFRSSAGEDKTLRLPVKSNVSAAVKELIRRSKIIRDFVETERLLIAQGIYHLATGKVDFWNVGQPVVVIEKEVAARKPASAQPKTAPHTEAKPQEEMPDPGSEHGWKKNQQWKQPEPGSKNH